MADTPTEQRLPSIHGLGRSAELLVQVASAQGFTVAAVGQNRFRMAQSFRPKWASITAIVLAPLAGLGLFLLLVRRTTSLDSVVEEHHKGVEVRLVGAGAQALAAELGPVLAGDGRPRGTAAASAAVQAPVARQQPAPPPPAPRSQPSPPPPPSPAQVPAAWHVAQPVSTFAPTPVRASPVPAAPLANSASPVAALVLPDGRRVALDRVVVIGRDPVDDGSAGASTVCAVRDPSLSKTHAAFGPSGAGAWVVDRHSTNGTTVTAGSGTRPCPPGIRVEVSVGSSVLLGDVAVTVVAT